MIMKAMLVPRRRYPIVWGALLLQSCFAKAIAFCSAVGQFLERMENTTQSLGDAYSSRNRFGIGLSPCPNGIRLGKLRFFWCC